MNTSHPLAAIAAIAFATSSVFAQAATLFEQIDTNKDGTVTKEEFFAFFAENDRKMDTDGNGLISAEEWPQDHKTAFESLDKNKDGGVSMDEIAEMRSSHFTGMDKDSNGTLDSSELN